MGRLTVFVLIALVLSGCLPGLPSPEQAQATVIVAARTLAAQTLAALPTSTPFLAELPAGLPLMLSPTAVPTDTPPLPTPTLPPSSQTGAPTAPNATATSTFPPATTSPSPTTTTTPTLQVTASRTPTATPGPLIYGTAPPAVPYGFVIFHNLSARPAYISFQCLLENGLVTILEYPVYGRFRVKMPAGPCQYVAYVREQVFRGEIRIKRFEEYTFTFKRNKLVITQP